MADRRRKISDIIANIIMVIVILIVIIPFYLLVITAFKSFPEILRVPPTFFPQKFTLEGFMLIRTHGGDVVRSFINSLVVASAVTLTTLFFSSLAGYAFAIYRFKLKEALFIAVISKYLLPQIILVIPWYGIMAKLGLIDNLLGIFIVDMIGAWTIYYTRSYISQIPQDYIDAARIDGASEPYVLFKIIWPMMKPAIGVIVVMNFLWSWNWFTWPLILLHSKENFTLPITIAFVKYIYGGGAESVPHWGAVASATLIYILPVIILYFIVQRWFIEAFIRTGIKA